MKILTLSILASLTLGAAALPTNYQTSTDPEPTVVYGVQNGTEYRTSSGRVYITETADVNEELSAPADQQTLRQIHGDPDEPKNRDLDKDIERTYNQKETIESDYGKEIEHEILEDRQKFNDKDDHDDDGY